MDTLGLTFDTEKRILYMFVRFSTTNCFRKTECDEQTDERLAIIYTRLYGCTQQGMRKLRGKKKLQARLMRAESHENNPEFRMTCSNYY